MGTITIFRIILSIFPQLLKANISFFLETRKKKRKYIINQFKKNNRTDPDYILSKIELKFINWRGRIPKGIYKEERDVM